MLMLFWVTNGIYQRMDTKFPTSASIRGRQNHLLVKTDPSFKPAHLVTDRGSQSFCVGLFSNKNPYSLIKFNEL